MEELFKMVSRLRRPMKLEAGCQVSLQGTSAILSSTSSLRHLPRDGGVGFVTSEGRAEMYEHSLRGTFHETIQGLILAFLSLANLAWCPAAVELHERSGGKLQCARGCL